MPLREEKGDRKGTVAFFFFCLEGFIILFNSFLFKLNLLAYRFQVYNSKQHHLHTAWCASRPKQTLSVPISLPFAQSTYPPAPFSSGDHISSMSMWLYIYTLFLNPFNFFYPVPQPPSHLTAVSLFHTSMPLFLFCSLVFCLLDSTCKWGCMVFIFL